MAMINPASRRRAFTGESLLADSQYSRRQPMSREEPDSEMIVVLTAAVAAYLDQPYSGVIIKEVKTQQAIVLWATYGKLRSMEARAGTSLIRRGRF